jgi:hypothetical protein
VRRLDLASPAFKANPYPFYAGLRAEEPVCPIVLPDKQVVWLVTRYDDVAMVLKDERFAKDRLKALPPEQLAKQPWVPALFRPLERNMLDVDPPDHTRLRALVQKAFTPRVVEQVRGRIVKLTEDLLDRAMERGRMDLVRDYALPLPTTIIAEMLGVPKEERHKFHRWSRAIVQSNPSAWRMSMPSSARAVTASGFRAVGCEPALATGTRSPTPHARGPRPSDYGRSLRRRGKALPSSYKPQELADFLGLRNAARQHHLPIHDDTWRREESELDHPFYRIVLRHFEGRARICHHLLHDAVCLFAAAAAGAEDLDLSNGVWHGRLRLVNH